MVHISTFLSWLIIIIRFFRSNNWSILILLITVNIIFQISIEKMEALYTTHDELFHLLDWHKQSLRTEYGPSAEFWSSFLEMAEILFAFNRSIRTGQWQAHLAVSKKMLPWFFAYDHQNYARYMSLYLGEISQPPETHPEIYK